MNKYAAFIIMPLLALTGCGGSNNSGGQHASSSMAPQANYRVTIINASSAQILSPAAVMIGDGSMSLFTLGEPASKALEKLAEAGMPDDLLTLYSGATVMSTGPTPQGMTTTVEISAPQDQHYLTLASMPVYTNDGIAAVQNIDISYLMTGESKTMTAPVYDAGTEANSEGTNTIPGPAIGGEGYNESRDGDRNFVAMHPGIVGEAELGSSALNESYRFSEGSFYITIERLN